jgi:hypothetical protein
VSDDPTPPALLGSAPPAEVIEGELLAALDPHAVTRTPHPWGVHWTCACGQWEGVATGRGSAAFVQGDYARHRHEQECSGGE